MRATASLLFSRTVLRSHLSNIPRMLPDTRKTVPSVGHGQTDVLQTMHRVYLRRLIDSIGKLENPTEWVTACKAEALGV